MLTIKRASPLGFVLVAIVVAEVIVLMPSRRIDESQPASFATPPQEVNLSIVGFHAVNLDSEGRRGTVDAKEAQIYKEKGFALLKDVDAKIYTRGDNTIRIRAQEGKYYLEKKDIEFFKDIVATSENLGYEFKSQSLKYEEESKLLSTDDQIWISGPDPKAPSLEATGVGLKGNTKTEEFSLLKEVRCKKHDVGAESLEIDSDKADVALSKNEALFKDNVVVRQKDMNIFTDNFLVAYNGRDQAIEKAKAFDQVKIVQADRVATCQKAFILNKEQKIVMTGHPKVVQGEDVVEGKIVIFFTRENKILFDEAVGEVKSLGEGKIDFTK